MKYLERADGQVQGFMEEVPEQLEAYEAGLAEGWVDVTTTWPPAPIPPTLVQIAAAELADLTGSSGTIMRCVAAGVSVPPAWSARVAALRAIANGKDTASTTLPAKPPYPAGT